MLSMETIPIQILSGKDIADPENMITWIRGDSKDNWLYVIRAYLDGDYEEPSPEDLPHVNEPSEACCAIS